VIPISLMLSAASAMFEGWIETGMQIGALTTLLAIGVLTGEKRFIEGRFYQESKVGGLLLILFVCSATVSSISSENQLSSLAYVVGIAICLLVCSGVWILSPSELLNDLKIYVIATAISALVIWRLTPDLGRRFGGVVHPNYWGLVCLSIFCLAALIKNLLFRSAIQLVSIAIIFASQSRSALLSVLAASCVFGYFCFRSARISKDIKLLLMVGIVTGTMVAFATAKEQIYDEFASAFRINDPYRGVGSGFSGRTALWRAGMDVLAAHPWFGVGAHMESNFISVGGITQAHNGYINTLVQFGTIGSGLFFGFFILSFWRLLCLARTSAPGASVGVALVIGYAVEAIFEPKLLNIGNPVSIVVLMFLLRPVGKTELGKINGAPYPYPVLLFR